MTVALSSGETSVVQAASTLDCGTLVYETTEDLRFSGGYGAATEFDALGTYRFVVIGGPGRQPRPSTEADVLQPLTSGRGAVVSGYLDVSAGEQLQLELLSPGGGGSAQIRSSVDAPLAVAGGGGNVGDLNTGDRRSSRSRSPAATPASRVPHRTAPTAEVVVVPPAMPPASGVSVRRRTRTATRAMSSRRAWGGLGRSVQRCHRTGRQSDLSGTAPEAVAVQVTMAAAAAQRATVPT